MDGNKKNRQVIPEKKEEKIKIEENINGIGIKAEETITNSLNFGKEHGVTDQVTSDHSFSEIGEQKEEILKAVQEINPDIEKKTDTIVEESNIPSPYSPTEQKLITLFSKLSLLIKILSTNRTKNIFVINNIIDIKNVLEIYLRKNELLVIEEEGNLITSDIYSGRSSEFHEAHVVFTEIYSLIISEDMDIPSKSSIIYSIIAAYSAYLKMNEIEDFWMYF